MCCPSNKFSSMIILYYISYIYACAISKVESYSCIINSWAHGFKLISLQLKKKTFLFRVCAWWRRIRFVLTWNSICDKVNASTKMIKYFYVVEEQKEWYNGWKFILNFNKCDAWTPMCALFLPEQHYITHTKKFDWETKAHKTHILFFFLTFGVCDCTFEYSL